MVDNVVKIVCPNCYGHKTCSARAPVSTPTGQWCGGKGWIWATVWSDR